MTHKLRQWPASVYPKEANEFPTALEQIDVALLAFARYGPAPEGHNIKPLGKTQCSLWQLNIKVPGHQIRLLYAPYGDVIVVFRIHKKSSPQEQRREYKLACKRKKEAESLMRDGVFLTHAAIITIH